MADSGISTLILLITSLIIATSIAGVATDLSQEISQDLDKAGDSVSTNINADINIISNPEFVYDKSNNELTVFVKNTGSESVPLDTSGVKQVDVFVDGDFQEPDTISFADSSGSPWRPGEVIKLQYNNLALSSGDEHTVSVILFSNEDKLRFFVPS